MKPILPLIFLLAFQANLSFAQTVINPNDTCTTPVSPSPTGLIAKWKFSGNAADSSGNGHHGSIVGTLTPTAGKKGIPNTALYFPGIGNHITVPYSPDFNLTNYSICAIVKPTVFYTGTCQGNAIIVKGPTSAEHWGIDFNDNAYNDCNGLDTNLYVFTSYAGTVSPTAVNRQYSPNVHTNNWYCVVATYNGSIVSVYVDGKLKSSYPASSTMGSGTSGIGIGIDLFTPSGANFPFTGIMDELRVYNRALSTNEICYFCSSTAVDASESIAIVNEKDYSIHLFPNPVHDVLTIQVGADLINAVKTYGIYNVLGQVVGNGEFTGEFLNLKTNDMAIGAYCIKVGTGANTITKQFSVE